MQLMQQGLHYELMHIQKLISLQRPFIDNLSYYEYLLLISAYRLNLTSIDINYWVCLYGIYGFIISKCLICICLESFEMRTVSDKFAIYEIWLE